MRKLKIVETTRDLAEFITHINTYNTFAFDIETTGLVPTKEKVIGFSISGKIGEAYYIPHLTWDNKAEKLVEMFSFDKCVEILNMLKQKELLMWNGSFDVRHTKWYFKVDLRHSLLADIMLMKHTVEEEGYFGLKKIAIQYQKEIGLDVESEANQEAIELKANVAKNGGSTTQANYEMYKADLEVMGKYAAADADLTLRLAHYFRNRLEKDGLVDFYYEEEVMPLYDVTIEMETRPVKLDIPLIEENKENIQKDIISTEQSIQEDLASTPEFMKWVEDNLSKKVPIKNTGKFAQKVAEIFNLNLPKTPTDKYKLSKKEVEKLPDSEAKSFLLGNISVESLKSKVPANCLSRLMFPKLQEEDGYLINFSHNIREIQLNLWKEENDGYLLNISSKKQLGEIVFDYFKEKPLTKTKKGNAQFNDAMIQDLVDKGYSWAKDLSDYNKLIKIKSAYMDRFLDNQIDGYYYFYYKQHGTLSGRYSSDAQQLPRPKEEGELSPLVLKYNNVIRKFFIAGEGRVFIDADYESLEPHVFSDVSGDEGLRNIFRKGHDFYSTIAIQTEKLDGMSADKKAENYLGSLNKPLRQMAKAYSLGVPYGMTPYALAKTLDVEESEAQKLYDGYLDGFPDLKKWMEQSKLDAQYRGYVTTKTGRKRHLDVVKKLHKKHGEKLLDFKYRASLAKKLTAKLGKFEAALKVTNMYRDYKNGINNSRNFQIQGLSASIVNRAMVEITRIFRAKNIDAWVCGTVHDQIIVNAPESRAKECADIVESTMCNIVELSVELKAPAEIAKNWADSH